MGRKSNYSESYKREEGKLAPLKVLATVSQT
jgi:hypothetical protein